MIFVNLSNAISSQEIVQSQGEREGSSVPSGHGVRPSSTLIREFAPLMS